ncbi:CaiB/BaiF CoA transferase family protein [Streptomyces iranensis]|uniref:Crotonobetainyl-CoA:carnitine CoA-transferase CaiB-like acyl-CoA transferase n=1 Tax=Streptomyces iranensis TaxID=576784 RepID=A0A060ZDH8_9ACTN|nr:CaiB/BaiF CoA-transferase family protein [Streptomyces iranensis]MBP2067069.1 crotonobetainyl-CoA:carnitine CoA-transferase CaiB-like acyl-CoA transferase [Streptomyces iranensis]CDR02648.1 L-carnitine dehydratase/bile acid-inducibleprotein F [Streptomyces iranensis]
MPAQPLEGITVVALEQAVAAPFATRQLADLGARVIKVERPGRGDFAREYDREVMGASAYFVWVNRGKESVVLDVKDATDRALLDAMLARADVFVHNLAPGAVDRLGLGAATLRAAHPRLITCAISGYGDSGPYREKKAYDLLIQCEAGLLSITGSPEAPARPGISIADIAGGMYAYTGILTALYERERTGAGTDLSVSLLDALGEWMGHPYFAQAYGGAGVVRSGARHPSISPYGAYRCGDGGQVFLSVQSDREWVALCERVLRRPELIRDPRFADNPLRRTHDEELTAELEACFADHTAEGLIALLDGAGIANARLRDLAEFAAHPQFDARDRWGEFGSPVGPLRGLLPPVEVAGRRAPMRPVPELGEHTEAVRAEFSEPVPRPGNPGPA